MRKPLLPAVSALAAGLLLQTGCTRSEAQSATPVKDLPTSPVPGSKCTLKIYLENGTSAALSDPEITGVLQAVANDWVCVKDGAIEHWIPKARVLELRITN